jgi:hypothetical protein
MIGVFLFMGSGVLLLSQLKINTSKSTMFTDMIVFGLGLGFSCQSLVSSIKFLPTEKSGIGSGIVNAARQIGTCIGIALLVSILDTNVANSKINMKNDALSKIHHAKIVDSMKTIMVKDINKSFSEDNTISETEQQDFEKKLKEDMQQALSSLATAPRTGNNQVLIASSVGLAAQKIKIQSTVNEIKADKDDYIANAFDKTFSIPAVILILSSICGIFTDRKNKKSKVKK